MANRTTVARVRSIMAEMAILDADIESYIGASNTYVNSRLADAGLAEIVLEEIERWVCAHMIACTRERMASKEAAGSASIEYIGEYTQQLSSTPYGQMAITLDTSGTLLASGMRQPWIRSAGTGGNN
jgi:hypothetical protein